MTYIAKINKIAFWLIVAGVSLSIYAGIAGFLIEPFDPVAKCDDFASWREAQTAFEEHPLFYMRLDRDKDKIACEHLI